MLDQLGSRHRATRSKASTLRGLEHVVGELVGKDPAVADLGPVAVRRFGDLIEAVGDFGE